ncbi:MAG: NAD(P)/FAD-dependent oxidoreductase [Nitrosospira sp.]
MDIAVVGGGPAGAICALTLARGGARVSLVHWGGYKISGIELVSGRARRLIEEYDPDFFRLASPGLEVHETISLWDTPEPVTLSAMFNPWGAGVALERELLDEALRNLASAAGVSVIADAKVMDIERRNDQWHLLMRLGDAENGSVCASFLVLATGRAAARFFDQPPPAPSQIALMTSLSARDNASNGVSDHALYVEAMDNGWWYALPIRRGGHFAGLCTCLDEIKRRRATVREFFVQELHRTRLLAPLMSSIRGNLRISGRTAGARAFSKVAGDSWIAVGDSAYAPDPLSGMGIELAIESAQLGAQALLGAMQGSPQQSAFAEYENAIRERANRHANAAAYHYGQL